VTIDLKEILGDLRAPGETPNQVGERSIMQRGDQVRNEREAKKTRSPGIKII
jgi:hypothetical protein